MKTALMWTISDFSAYGKLSGWNTHEDGHKPCWFNCHRQFFFKHHPFQKQQDSFRRNKIEKDHAPLRLSGMKVFQRVSQLDEVPFGIEFDKQKSQGFGTTHN